MSGGNQQIVHTICFHTKDAINREEGKFVFSMPGDAPRLKAVKLMLGSLEFPTTQYTVEHEWSNIYFNEGFNTTTKNRSLHMRAISQSTDDTQDVFINLPIRTNPIIKWRIDKSRGLLLITFKHPHGLWSNNATHCIVDDVWWNSVLLIGSPLGTVSLGTEPRLYYESATTFGLMMDESREGSITVGINDVAPRAGYLYFPDFPNIYEVYNMLTICSKGSHNDISIIFDYNAKKNKPKVIIRTVSSTYNFCIFPTKLGELLGLGSSERFEKIEPSASLILPTEVCGLWNAVALTPGWYVPSHRPMLSGQPKPFTPEVENAMNRLNFPLPERVAESSMTAYYLVFIDPSGTTLFCPVPCGKYTPNSLCSLLEQSMSVLSLSSTPGVSFSVSFEQNRFIFSCEVRDSSDRVQPAIFTMVMNHPQQFDPEKIGFLPLLYSGSNSYTSLTPCVMHSYGNPYGDLMISNSYRFADLGSQERFRMHSSPSYSITGVIVNYEPNEASLLVKTFVGQLPYSHGFLPGDVLQIIQTGPTEVLVSSEEGWVEKSVTSCPISTSWNRYAVVLTTGKTNELYPSTLVKMRVRPSNELVDCIGQTIGLQAPTRPFNLCVGIHQNSIKPSMLGVSPGALQWGIDGSCYIQDKIHKISPYIFPFIHNLDHTDYVLLYLDDGKRGTLLSHHYNEKSTSPLCKIVLYPMLREERMLPRDTMMISGESLSTFTLRFTNPDGSPYKFHGADFSFSLNLIKMQD